MRRFRTAFLLLACLVYVIQAPFAQAASTTDKCDPNNPERRAKQIFRATNDILYFDECAGTCSGSASATLLPGDNYAEKAYNYLISKGYTPEQAAGVVGNMIAESGVNPQRLQGTPLNQVTTADVAVTKGGGWGIVQWTPSSKMINPTKDAGKDPNDLGVQLDFLTNELTTNEKAAGDKLHAATTVSQASLAFENGYERHAADASSPVRALYAQAIFNKATKGEPYPPEVDAAIYKGNGFNGLQPSVTAPTSPSAPSSCGSAASDNGECKNPFRDLKDSASLRFDGGLDYGGNNGSGPVYAACPAKIEEVTTSWPGSPGLYLRYEITAGKAKGLHMYIAEDCTATVKTGDVVTTDQPICQYEQRGTFLETGWAKGTCYCGANSSYVEWSDYPQSANDWASNSGIDVGRFLETLGVGKGTVQSGPSTVPPPADWPKW
jgi:hypothetical protein